MNKPDPRHGEIRRLLQSVVLALMGVERSQEEIEPDHLPAIANVAAARDEVPPFAVQIHVTHVDEAVDHEDPHHGEVPVSRTAQPPAKGEPRRNRMALERIAAESLAFTMERRISIEDPKPRPRHDQDGDDGHPMRDAHDQVVAKLHVRGPRPRSCQLLMVALAFIARSKSRR